MTTKTTTTQIGRKVDGQISNNQSLTTEKHGSNDILYKHPIGSNLDSKCEIARKNKMTKIMKLNVMMMMIKIIFWAQDHDEDDDGQGVL